MAEVKLYNANEGLTGRGDSIFSDREEQKVWEERSAKIEGREPDYDNMRAGASVTLVTASQLIEAASVNNPGSLDSGKQEAEAAIIEASPVEHVAVLEIPDEEEAAVEAEPTSEDEDPFEGTEASKE